VNDLTYILVAVTHFLQIQTQQYYTLLGAIQMKFVILYPFGYIFSNF